MKVPESVYERSAVVRRVLHSWADDVRGHPESVVWKHIPSYPTDLRDEHWNLLRPLLPPRSTIGRPPAQRRRIVNAVLYLQRAGCAWRMLPKEYDPWSTVYGVFRGWVKEGV